ncbi:hypothetical protein D9599_25750 [Roseomonas sp. KE2513]|nr:hypothetical protein [Roseomonas sp. KE2513]
MMPASIHLTLLPDAPDVDGLPRAGLVVPPQPGAVVRRPLLLLFPTVAAAVAAKQAMEAPRHG